MERNEYYAYFEAERTRLTELAADLYKQKAELEEYCVQNTVQHVYASQSNLERGYFCPSPTRDLVVGGCKRGRLLKQLRKNSNPSHVYGLNQQGEILWCGKPHKGIYWEKEYIVRKGNTVYGLTLHHTGQIIAVSEEIYDGDLLACYTFGVFDPYLPAPICTDVNKEYCQYDNGLISRSTHYHYLRLPNSSSERNDKDPSTWLSSRPMDFYADHIFARENGRLTSFTCGGKTYPVKTDRNI